VLLPGLLCDAHVWTPQIAALGADWHIAVADLRGHDSIGAMAEAVLENAPPRFALAGHSMGGRVALQIMRVAPGRVERLALLDTGFQPAAASEPQQRQVLVDLARREGMRALAAHWLPPMVHPRRLHDAALMRALTAMVERMTPALLELQIRALLSRPDATGVLPGIRCPTLIGVGRQDGWSPLAQHQAMAAAVEAATLAVFEDCGHMSTVEAPDAVSVALRAWLEG
jgi:pimeloyl-ACP methyl ester carboxylesterase